MRRNELLFDAIGSIEDSLLARTEEKERKTTRPLCASVVSLCLLFMMGVLLHIDGHIVLWQAMRSCLNRTAPEKGGERPKNANHMMVGR